MSRKIDDRADPITPAEERWIVDTWRNVPQLEQLALRLLAYRMLEGSGCAVDSAEWREIVFAMHAESLKLLLDDTSQEETAVRP